MPADRKRRRIIEITIAWACMVTLIASVVAAAWIVVGTVAGLAALGVFAAVTGWMAQAGTLIEWDQPREDDRAR
jgi:hypothetical protein